MAHTEILIAIEDPVQPEILALLRDGAQFSVGKYPPESIHQPSPEELCAPEVLFHVARDGSGHAIATGAVVLHGDWAEIKRMWVVPDARQKGIARRLLAALEAAAKEAGAAVLRLETGVFHDAAQELYARSGYLPREPFADYRPDPLSIFMEKPLLQD